MYKSKLIQLLQILNKEEKEAFLKWVNSPAHLSHKETQKLIKLLLKKRKLTPFTTNNQRIFSQLFPNKNYDDRKLKHLMSYAVKTLENFIEFSLKNRDDRFFKKINIRKTSCVKVG